MTAEFNESNSDKVSDKLICESCGKDFSCGAKVGKCWCFEIQLKAETLTDLRQDFDGCLCENCLNKLNDYQKEI